MNRKTAACLAACGSLIWAASAHAATYTDAVTGVEVAATSTEGTFAGVASGALPGAWNAVVEHTPLAPDATITGGTFTLSTVLDGSPTTIGGTFTGGSVTRIRAGAHCRNQTYAIDGTLANVAGTGSGRFAATLTHYRRRVLGHCVTYAASVTGTVSLTF